FPAKEIASALKGTKVVLVADRQESYGGWGGNMTFEVKAALKDDPDNRSLVISRIYGIGGKEFFVEDAEMLFEEALEAALVGKIKTPFAYIGATEGDAGYMPERVADPLTEKATTLNLIKIERSEATGRLEVKGVSARELTAMPKRIAPGHGACPGCGIFPSVDQFLKGIQGHVVILFHTGCGMVVTTGFPYSAFNVTYIHNLFQNGAPTLSGVVEAFEEKKRRGEIPADRDITFIMVSGDGGLDIGMGPAIGTALRNHSMIILEYDNQGYMNTGHQLSFSTPFGHATSTSNVGPRQFGKTTHHKDTPQIMAACNLPYIFTAVESDYRDLIKKAAKAQRYTKEGLVYGKLLSACPLSWKSDERMGSKIVQAAVDSNFFPLYEIEHGKTILNYNPEGKGKKVPVAEWLKMMGKT
ncbi:MAG: thiamine pyrophosphate-dependent enzyme, partial [Nitrospirota bacterium]